MKVSKLFVGDPLTVVTTPQIIAGSPIRRLITPASPEFAVSPTLLAASAVSANTLAWSSANDPVGCEFWLADPETVFQLGWRNGNGTMTDSCDLGIYDKNDNRLVSTGATARVGAGNLQFVDVTDTFLPAGRYRLVMSNDGVTASNVAGWAGSATALEWGRVGLFDSLSNSYPLPNPLVGFGPAATFLFCPVMYVGLRPVY